MKVKGGEEYFLFFFFRLILLKNCLSSPQNFVNKKEKRNNLWLLTFSSLPHFFYKKEIRDVLIFLKQKKKILLFLRVVKGLSFTISPLYLFFLSPLLQL